MEAFFARYPPFRFDSQQPPTAEFARLKATKPRWINIPRDPRYLRAHAQFRLALNAQNAASGNAVAKYFAQFPEFDYDPRREDLDALREFERLAGMRNWPARGPAYTRNRTLFDLALKSVEENASQQVNTVALVPSDPTATAALGNSQPGSSTVAVAADPLAVFFAGFASFNYDPSRDADSEFNRLATSKRWSIRGSHYRGCFRKFKKAKLESSTLQTITRIGPAEFAAAAGIEGATTPAQPAETTVAGTEAATTTPAQPAETTIVGTEAATTTPAQPAETTIVGTEAATTTPAQPAETTIVGTEAATTTPAQPAETTIVGTEAATTTPAQPAETTVAGPEAATTTPAQLAETAVTSPPDPNIPEPVLPREDPLQVFFAQFLDFTYDPMQGYGSASEQFARLAELKGWETTGEDYIENHKLLQVAIEETEAEISNVAPTTPVPTSPVLVPVVIKPAHGDGPLDEFFRTFHNFTYEPSTPSESEFERLTQQRGWKRGKKRFRKARGGFLRATEAELLFHLDRDDILLPTVAEEEDNESQTDQVPVGSDNELELEGDPEVLAEMERDRKPWKRLCDVLDLRMSGTRRRPYTEEECKEVLSGVYINIFDFIYHLRLGKGTLQRFPGLGPLAEYSYRKRRVFPRATAEKSPILGFLLKPIGKGMSARPPRRGPAGGPAAAT